MSLSNTPLLKDKRILNDDDGDKDADEERGEPSQRRGVNYGSTTARTMTDGHHHHDDDDGGDEGDGGSVYVYSYPTHLQTGHFTSLEKLCFFLSSFLFVLLCLFVGLYARNAIQKHHNDTKPTIPSPTSSPGVPSVPTPPPDNHTHSKTYCLEPNCIITAAHILQDVDQEQNPCEDFYAYTCSRWQENHIIPQTKSRVDVHSITSDTVRHRLDHILTDHKRSLAYNDGYFGTVSSSSSLDQEQLGEQRHDSISSLNGLPNPTDILDHQLFTKLSDFYRSCMDQERIDKRGVEPLYELLRVIRDFIPLTATGTQNRLLTSTNNTTAAISATLDAVDNDQRQRALVYLSERDVWPLFTVSSISALEVQEQQHQGQTMSTYDIGVGQIGLPSIELYENEHIMTNYLQTVISLLDAIFQKDTANEFGFKTWSTIATARRIIDFEKTIVRAAMSVVEEEGVGKGVWWTLEELQHHAPEIQWTSFLPSSSLAQNPHQQKTLIRIPSVHFMENLRKQVLSNRNSRTLQMYFMWRTIWRYLDSLGEEFMMHKRKWTAFMEGRVEHVKAIPERRDTCIDLIDQKSSAMGVLLGRYYVLDHLEAIKEARVDLKNAVQHWIMDVLIDRVSNLTWVINQEEQAEIVRRLQNIQFEIGYPPPPPSWSSDNTGDQVESILLDVLYLSEYFGDLRIDPNDLFGNVVRSNMHKIKKERKRQNGHDAALLAWKLSAHSVNVHYQKETNKVIIPAGLLQLPYFDPHGPYYLYLGSIGWMIGHEIMHEFDSMITKETRMAGKNVNRTTINKCLIKQYNELGVDGSRTLDENFADNGALSLLQYYFDYSKEEKRMTGHAKDEIVPGIDHWTKEQTAYIQFGRMRCSKTIYKDNHPDLLSNTAPDRLRVNGPIMNSYHFAKTFSCKKGSQMHPDTHARPKCQVW